MLNSSILLLHPEGNFNNNPHLDSFINLLVQNGSTVHILAPRTPGRSQRPPCKNVTVQLIESQEFNGPFFLTDYDEKDSIEEHLNQKLSAFDLIIGVDRGIIEASMIANIWKVPYGLISYEIFFEDEAGKSFKSPEIKACTNLDFAIVQDKVRAHHLCKQNQISSDKIHYMPVAGQTLPTWDGSHKPKLFHKMFNLDPNAKIVLFMGSVSKWSMVPELVESASNWSKDWHLIIHNRFGLNPQTQSLLSQVGNHPQIHFSTTPYDTPDEMTEFIRSADIGCAFYKASYSSIYTGKNLEYIGMASGKSNAYLQHGIPVLCNPTGEMSGFIQENNLGIVATNPTQFTPNEFLWTPTLALHCQSIFKKTLSSTTSFKHFLPLLKSLLSKRHLTNSTMKPTIQKQLEDHLNMFPQSQDSSILAKYHNDLGVLYYLAAQEQLSKALTIYPNYPEAQENLDFFTAKTPKPISFHFLLPTSQHYLAMLPEKEEVAWSQLLEEYEKQPQNPSLVNDLGVFCFHRKKEFLAYYYLQEAHNLNPTDLKIANNFQSIQNKLPRSSFPQICLSTPNYNQGKYIETCILSILNQNYPAIQYNIIDGNSTDESVAVIKKYEEKLHYWVSEPDNGQSDAINKGIAAADGDIYNWICGDDYLEPGALFAVAQAWSENKSAAAWVGAAKRVLEDNQFLHYISYPNGLEKEQVEYNFTARSFYQPACFMNMAMVKQLQGVREELHFTMDYDLFVRLRQLGDFVSIPHILCTALAQPDAKTVQFMGKLWQEKIELYKEYQFDTAIPNLQNRIQNSSDWNYVIPPILQEQLQRKQPQLSNLPLSSRCRNGAIHNGTYLVVYANFQENPKETLAQLKTCAEIILGRINGITLKICGPGVEIAQNAFQHPSLQFSPKLWVDRTDSSFCQAAIILNTNANVDLAPLSSLHEQGVPLITDHSSLKALGLTEGQHSFAGYTAKDFGFQAVQICYEPSVWGAMVANLLLK